VSHPQITVPADPGFAVRRWTPGALGCGSCARAHSRRFSSLGDCKCATPKCRPNSETPACRKPQTPVAGCAGTPGPDRSSCANRRLFTTAFTGMHRCFIQRPHQARHLCPAEPSHLHQKPAHNTFLNLCSNSDTADCAAWPRPSHKSPPASPLTTGPSDSLRRTPAFRPSSLAPKFCMRGVHLPAACASRWPAWPPAFSGSSCIGQFSMGSRFRLLPALGRYAPNRSCKRSAPWTWCK
jgi:hypothetical protein